MPLGNARAEILVHDPDQRVLRRLAEAATDASGTFKLGVESDSPDRFVLRLTHSGFPARNVVLPLAIVRNGGDLGTIVLPTGVRVAGVLRTHEGQPAVGELVWHLHDSLSNSGTVASDPSQSLLGSNTVGADGTFDLGVLRAGRLEIAVRLQGTPRWREVGQFLVPFDQESLDLQLTLLNDVVRTVLVHSAGGSPVHGVVFRAMDTAWTTRDSLVESLGPDEQGRYQLRLTVEFGGRVVLAAPGFRSGMVVVSKEQSDLGEIVLAAGSDAVRVQLQGAAEGERLLVGIVGRGRRRTRLPALHRMTVGAGGLVHVRPPVDGIEAGMTVLAVDRFSADGRCWLTRDIGAEDYTGAQVPIACSPRPLESIAVSCVDGRSRQPVPGAVIALLRAAVDGATIETSWGTEIPTASGFVPLDHALSTARTDDHGHAFLPFVSGFQYQVSASAASHATMVAPAGEARMELLLEAEARLIVALPPSSVTAYATPTLFRVGRRQAMEPVAQDDATITYAGLLPGRYMLGYDLLRRFVPSLSEADFPSLESLETVKSLNLRAGETVRASLEDPGGLSWVTGEIEPSGANGEITLADIVPFGAPTDTPPMDPVGVHESSRFELGPLLPGRYHVRLYRVPSRPVYVGDLELAPSTHLRVKLRP